MNILKDTHVTSDAITSIDNARPDIQKQIFIEQLQILYKNLIVSMPANFVCATLVFLGLYQLEANALLWSWYIAVVAITLLRVTASYFYHGHPDATRIHFPIFIMGVFLTAICWGIAGSLLMIKNNLAEQTIIIIILAGITAGGIQTLQANLLACVICVTFIILPLSVWLLMQNGIGYLILGVATVTYLICMLLISKRSSHLLKRTLELRFENKRLINNLFLANKQLENEYKIEEENKKNLRKIIDSAPIGMAIVSLQGHWLQVNHALCEIVGYSESELENLTFQELIYQDDQNRVREYIQKLTSGEISSYQFDTRYTHKNGKLIWVQLNASLMRNSDNQPQYFITQIQDISERKNSEKSLSELNEKTKLMLNEIKQREYEVTTINKMNEMLGICVELNEAYSSIMFTLQELLPNLSGSLVMLNKNKNMMETVKQWGDGQLLKTEFAVEDCWSLREGSPYTICDPKQEIICQHFISPLKTDIYAYLLWRKVARLECCI